MLYGRDSEQAEIGRLLEQARAGRSGALSVSGEAGSGKTALLDFAVQAAGGMQVLRGTCIESEAELPFAGLHLLLRPARPALDALPAPQAAALRAAFGLADAAGADRFLAGIATLTLLAELADGAPLLCVCDDAQWLDQASATALLFAARRLDAEGILLIFGSREGGRLREAAGLPVLRLGPLDRDASIRLLAERAPDLTGSVRDRIIEQSQGNPLALIELPAALSPEQRAGQLDPRAFYIGTLPVSSRVQDAFQAQIADLPEPSRLLLIAAAADDTGDLAVLLRAARTLGASLEDLTAAERARLIRLDGTLRFRHPLIRTAAYQSASSSQRMAVHAALARALEGTDQQDRRAWHLAASAAGPDEPISAALERAAEYARERGGYAAEAAAYERAAQLSPGREDAGRRLALAAGATAAAGQMRRASVMADRAARLVSDPIALAGLAEVKASVEFEQGSSRDAARIVLGAAAGIAAQAPDVAARMLSSAVHYASYGSDPDAAVQAVRAFAALAVPPDLEPFVPAATGLAHMIADQVPAGVREIRSTLRPLADGASRLAPAMRLAVVVFALMVGDDKISLDVCAALVDTCRARGLISVLPYAMNQLCIPQQFLGKLTDARANATEALRIAEDTSQSHRVSHLRGVLARIAAIEGDEQACAALAGRAAYGDSAPAAGWAGTSLALLDLGLGRYEAVLSRLSELAAGPARHTLIVIVSLPDLVEAAVGAHRPESGMTALARFEEFSSAAAQPWASAVTLRCHALLGYDPGDSFEQAVRLHAAAGQWDRPFERARTELAYGRWLRRNRRRADARVQLESALGRFGRLGAVPWAAQAGSELRAAGVAPVAQAGGVSPVAQLTAQELQVVRRAAAGMSNREIAAELFLSPRTVGYHLYKAYPKLHVTTRAQLAAITLPDQ